MAGRKGIYRGPTRGYGRLIPQKAQNWVVPPREPEAGETAEQVEKERQEEQEKIDNCKLLLVRTSLSARAVD